MRTTAQLFDECLATVKNNVKMELDYHFYICSYCYTFLRIFGAKSDMA